MRCVDMDVSSDTEKCTTDARKLEKWLELTSTRYNSLKTYMNYMKMCLHDCQPSTSNHNIQIADNIEETSCNDFMKELCSNQSDNRSLKLHCYSKVGNISPKIKEQHVKEEDAGNQNMSRELQAELNIFTPRTYSISESASVQLEPLSLICKEDMQHNEANTNWQSSSKQHFPENSGELTENIKNQRKSYARLILDNENQCLPQDLSSVRDDLKLNISRSVKGGSLSKSKIRAKGDRKDKSSRKSSLCKLDEISPLKHKRRKGKLRCSYSKSTVTTRDTNFIGRKDMKKRKQKNGTNNRATSRSQQSSNEVVEIYHNVAAKNGSTSAIASKLSKPGLHTNCMNRLSLSTNNQPSMHVKPKCERNDYHHNHQVDDNKWQVGTEKQYRSKVDAAATHVGDQSCCNLKVTTPSVFPTQKCNSHQYQYSETQETYCDPLIAHNYEMPTLASKLKRANRSYFSRLNFRNIPFVVGTSVTPSHNLGLNIQQVLSIMKTRQPTTIGATPLKISRCMNPVNILMKQMNTQYSKLRNMNSQISNTVTRREHSFISERESFLENETVSIKSARKGLNNSNPTSMMNVKGYGVAQERIKENSEQLHKKKDTGSENDLDKPSTAQISRNASGTKEAFNLFASRQNVQAEIETSDLQSKTDQDCEDICNFQSGYSQNSKGIREVLVNHHAQFEKMNTKYEKLKEKVETCHNKELEEEMLQLEKELNAKEDEINAVLGLYKEVMALKHQMKLIQGRNSYVCISTEVPLGVQRGYSAMPFRLTKSYGTDLQRKHLKRGHTTVPREPSTSIRLAGLLRQIQTFQKQLRLTS